MKPPTKIERLLRILEDEVDRLAMRMGGWDCHNCECDIHRSAIEMLESRVRERFEKEEKARKEQSR